MKTTVIVSLLISLRFLSTLHAQSEWLLEGPEIPAEITPAEYDFSVSWGRDGTSVTRDLIVVVPEGYQPEERHPLVHVLHGSFGSASRMRNLRQGLVDLANRHQLVLVFPEGQPAGPEGFKWQIEEGDLDYLVQLTRWLGQSLAIDPDQVFFSGFSNGGGMVQAVAALRPKMIAGAVVFSAANGQRFYDPETGEEIDRVETPAPRGQVPIVILRGGPGDLLVPPDGRLSKEGTRHNTVAEQFSFWLDGNGCDPEKVKTVELGEKVTIRYENQCSSQSAVYSIYAEDLGHRWPGPNDQTGINGDQLLVDFVRSLKPRPRPRIDEISRQPDNKVHLTFVGKPGEAYFLETSEQLNSWSRADFEQAGGSVGSSSGTLLATGEEQTVVVEVSGLPACFFRMVSESRDQIPFLDAFQL